MEAHIRNRVVNILSDVIFKGPNTKYNFELFTRLRTELSNFIVDYGSSAERIHLDDLVEAMNDIIDSWNSHQK